MSNTLKVGGRTITRTDGAAFLAAFHTAAGNSSYPLTYELFWLSQPESTLLAELNLTEKAWALFDKWLASGKKPLSKRDLRPLRRTPK